MTEHLRRKVEQWIGAHLALVPGLICVPSDGDDALVPPYAVASADEDNAEVLGELTSVMNVDAIYATSIHDTPVAAHAAQYRAMQARMLALRIADVPELGLIVHGAQMPPGEVSGMSVSAEQAHGDVVSVNCGATDMGPSLSGAEALAFSGTGRFCGLLGDGAARTFTVTHGLGTVALGWIILRDAAADGTVHVCNRDYTLAILDANTVRLTLLDQLAGVTKETPGLTTPVAGGLLLSLRA